MNSFFPVLLSFLLASSLYAQADLEGRWNTGKENTIIRMYQKDGVMLGEIVSSDNPKATAGKQLIKDLKQKDNGWEGRLFVPKKQKWFDASFKRAGDKLQVSVNAGLISKTTHWEIVKPNRH